MLGNSDKILWLLRPAEQPHWLHCLCGHCDVDVESSLILALAVETPIQRPSQTLPHPFPVPHHGAVLAAQVLTPYPCLLSEVLGQALFVQLFFLIDLNKGLIALQA